MNERRQYAEEEKAEAIGLSLSIGIRGASRQLGIPHRTISNWRATPKAEAIIVRSRDDVAAKLWEAVQAGTDAVLAGLRDPKGRLSDKARALEVVASQHALLTGDATVRTENLNVNASVTDHLSDEQRSYLAKLIDAELDRRAVSDAPEAIADPTLSLDWSSVVALSGIERRLGDGS